MKNAGTSVKVISLVGEFDLSRADQLADLLDAGIDCNVVIVDFRDVTYVDSTALSSLIRFRTRLASHGGIVGFIAIPPRIRRLFEICKFDGIFPMYESLREAEELLGAT
jgi:anti-sigma B factor antagonist